MPKSGRTTTEEGYGWTHQQARAQLLAELQRNGIGQCPRCLHAIYPEQAAHLDAGHSGNRKADGLPPDQLEHRRCNRAAGAREGNSRRGSRRSSRRAGTAHPNHPPLPEW